MITATSIIKLPTISITLQLELAVIAKHDAALSKASSLGPLH
jgi:hypothetical protein